MGDITSILTSYLKPSGPVHSVHCARVLCGCLHLLDGRRLTDPFAPDESYVYPRSPHYTYLREHYPDYLSACAAYLSQPLGEKESLDILDTDVGSVCVCSMEGPTVEVTRLLGYLHQFHTSRKFILRDLFYALIRHLGGILTDAVQSRSVGAFTAMRGLRRQAKKHTGNLLWPMDSDQLLPHGLADSAKGYADAICLCHNLLRDTTPVDSDFRFQDPLLLLGKLIAICGRSIVPHLLNYGSETPCAMYHLARVIERAVTAADGKIVDRRTELSWLGTIWVLLEFCQITTRIDVRDPTGLFILIRKWPPKDDATTSVSQEPQAEAAEPPQVFSYALAACSIALQFLPRLPKVTNLFTEEFVDSIAQVFSSSGAVYLAYRLPEDKNMYHQDILDRYMRSVALVLDPRMAAFECFHWAFKVRHCCAPECQETFGSAKRQFAQCAGCGVLRYCSRECQRTAWKYDSLPHKDVCTKLRVLRERTGLPKDRDRWDPSRYREQFFNVCIADEGLTALAEDCSAYIHGLMALRQGSNLSSATTTLSDIPEEHYRELAPVFFADRFATPVDPSVLCYMDQE
ncbi:hypothetical protein FOMPIDRAFT_1053028 [Fomitopsis schrenkii]|uniref:MYND-type domain-containing protein n=1 Tax=Fomitopsis schrenkii TaxID=2126942 RepID=S8F4Q4_FOMSC|nr:hypothetical protein FOMPIDRAFT_1053028 [Fomitopsis schrenkii]